jgi:uncharacterized repeat protein (TIGR03803 family)
VKKMIVTAVVLSAFLRVPADAAQLQNPPIDGRNPQAQLIGDSSGAFYGTTVYGGDRRCEKGCGTVYKLTPSGSRYRETILYSFHANPDGAEPFAGLITDNSGSLYGTTALGGANGYGTVYKLTPTMHGYRETVLYSFVGNPSGGYPYTSLLEDSSGSLYGTTILYGPANLNDGTVFKLTRHGSGYSFSVLHAFHRFADGAYPDSALIADASGALYGTAETGGVAVYGSGTVFKLTPDGPNYDFSVLHSFIGPSDGALPSGALATDGSGALYGTTFAGGTSGKGIVFKLTPAGGEYSESVLHTFTGGDDGHHPAAGVIIDGAGSLFGTTLGTTQGQNPPFGTVFELKPSAGGYDYSILHIFEGGPDGMNPQASLIEIGGGRLYGTTSAGGTLGLGTVYRLSPGANGYRESILHNFQQ